MALIQMVVIDHGGVMNCGYLLQLVAGGLRGPKAQAGP